MYNSNYKVGNTLSQTGKEFTADKDKDGARGLTILWKLPRLQITAMLFFLNFTLLILLRVTIKLSDSRVPINQTPFKQDMHITR